VYAAAFWIGCVGFECCANIGCNEKNMSCRSYTIRYLDGQPRMTVSTNNVELV
jgi:hypothetical protein